MRWAGSDGQKLERHHHHHQRDICRLQRGVVDGSKRFAAQLGAIFMATHRPPVYRYTQRAAWSRPKAVAKRLSPDVANSRHHHHVSLRDHLYHRDTFKDPREENHHLSQNVLLTPTLLMSLLPTLLLLSGRLSSSNTHPTLPSPKSLNLITSPASGAEGASSPWLSP